VHWNLRAAGRLRLLAEASPMNPTFGLALAFASAIALVALRVAIGTI
jgi:hypothetical protein